MWQVAQYNPTTLFSLRPYNATTSGGKTLLVPTPFAIKMALLDVTIRVYGIAAGELGFPLLRDLTIAVRLPDTITVNKTFIKILRPHKAGAKDTFGIGLDGPMGNTIAYQELVHFGGMLAIAIQQQEPARDFPPLRILLSQISYLGKRGGFMQFTDLDQSAELTSEFTLLNPPQDQPFPVHGLLQMLDDCGPKMTFGHANVYSKKRVPLNKSKGRILKPVILPFHPVKSSRSFTLFERIAG